MQHVWTPNRVYLRNSIFTPIKDKLIAHPLLMKRGYGHKGGKNEYMSLEVIDQICNYLDCFVLDVLEYVKDEKGR
jgi:hypothetical protein